MAYEIQVNINSPDPSPLNRIADALGGIATKNKLAAQEIKFFEEEIARARKTGEDFTKVLKDVEAAVGGGNAMGRAARELREYAEGLKAVSAAAGDHKKVIDSTIDSHGRLKQILTALATQQAGISLPFGSRSALAGLLPGGGATIGALAGIAGAGIAINEIRSLTSETANYGREITNLSLKTGLSIREAQIYSRTAEITGQSVNSVVTQVRQLSRALAENSDEGRRAKQALAEFLPTKTIERLPFMQTGAALKTVYGGLGAVENPIQKRRLASTIFGRQGLETLPFAEELARGPGDIEAAGGIFSPAQTAQAKEYKRQTELLGIAYDNLKLKIGLGLIPVVSGIVGFLDHLAKSDIRRFLMGPAAPPARGGRVEKPDEDILGDIYRNEILPDKLAAISKRVNTYLDSGDGSKEARIEGLERQHKQALSERATAIDKIASGTEAEALAAEKSVRVANQKALAIKQQIEALKNYEQTAKRIFDLEAQMGKRFTGPFGAIEAHREEFTRDIKNPEQRARANRDFSQEITQQAREENIRVSREAAAEDEKDRNEAFRLQAHDFQRELREDKQTGRQLDSIQLQSERSDVIAQSSRATRLAELQQAPGAGLQGEARAINQGYQERVALAQQLYDFELRRLTEESEGLSKEEAGRKALIGLAEAERDKKKEERAAEIEHEIKIAELRKKELEEARNFSGGIYDALRSPQGAGAGLKSFFQSELDKTGRTIFQNITQDAVDKGLHSLGQLIPGQTIPGETDEYGNPKLSRIGKALQGTKLAQTPAISDTHRLSLATDNNTKSTSDNTDALNRLTQAISHGGGTTQRGAQQSSRGAGGIGSKGRYPWDEKIPDTGGTGGIESIDFASLPLSTTFPGARLPGSAAGLLPVRGEGVSESIDYGEGSIPLGGASITGGIFGGGPGADFGVSESIDFGEGPTDLGGTGSPFAISGMQAPVSDRFGLARPPLTASGVIGGIMGIAKKGGLGSLSKLFGGGGGGSDTVDSEGGVWGGGWDPNGGAPGFGPDTTTGIGNDSGAFGPDDVTGIGADSGGFGAGFSPMGALAGIMDLTKQGTGNKVAGGLEIAASIDPEPISKAVLAVAAIATHIFTGIFGETPQKRENEIKKKLEGDQFYTPVGENISESTGGTFADSGRGGFVRNSPFSPFPSVEEPYYDFRNHVLVPGRTDSQFGGTGMPAINQTGTVPGPAAPIVINIHAMDPGSFESYLKRNPTALNEGMRHALQTQGGFVGDLRENLGL